MTDRVTPKHRSWNMAQIRSKDTSPELAVRSILHKLGFRFRIHVRTLPGCPDIVLPKYKTIILVNGCFWHRHRNCKFAYSPKSRTAFWNAKFAANVLRDSQVRSHLRRLGWKVIVIWECQAKRPDTVERLARRLLSG